MGVIFGIVAVVIIAGLVAFPETRTWLKGAAKIFVRDRLSTPEGAEAFFTEMIEEATDKYNEAHTACVKIAGNQSRCAKVVEELRVKLLQCQNHIDAFVAKNDMKNAELENEYWCELDDELNVRLKDLEDLTVASKDATEAMALYEKEVEKLKKDKVRVVNDLKTKKQIAEAYQSLNEIKSTANDKTLDYIREKAKETSDWADGERMMYNNRTSVKLEKAEREAKRTTSGYLGQLKSRGNVGTSRVLTDKGMPVNVVMAQTVTKEKVNR